MDWSTCWTGSGLLYTDLLIAAVFHFVSQTQDQRRRKVLTCFTKAHGWGDLCGDRLLVTVPN